MQDLMVANSQIDIRLQDWTDVDGCDQGDMAMAPDTIRHEQDLLRDDLLHHKHMPTGITSLQTLVRKRRIMNGAWIHEGPRTVIDQEGAVAWMTAHMDNISNILDNQAREITAQERQIKELKIDKTNLEGTVVRLERDLVQSRRIIMERKIHSREEEGQDTNLDGMDWVGQANGSEREPGSEQEPNTQRTGKRRKRRPLHEQLYRFQMESLEKEMTLVEDIFGLVRERKWNPFQQELEASKMGREDAFQLRGMAAAVLKNNVDAIELVIKELRQGIAALRGQDEAFLDLAKTRAGTWMQALEVHMRYASATHALEASVLVLQEAL
ncbi:hypothetical protein BGX33_000267 [Mortierella sp. NVP41]|nr:hypothetical protein BGX33_000267 [Mortierella sp. NVP41]